MDLFHATRRLSACLLLTMLWSGTSRVCCFDEYEGPREKEQRTEGINFGNDPATRVARSTSNEATVAASWKVIELSVVCDKRCYDRMIERDQVPETFIYETVKEASKRMEPTYTTLTLVQLEIWSTHDLIDIEEDADVMTASIREYRENVLLPKAWSDATFLVTGSRLMTSTGQKDGWFGVGVICTMDAAGILSLYDTQSGERLAQFMVHELGHALGAYHDTNSCRCEHGDGNCVMGTTMNTVQITYSAWSDCSIDYIAENLGYDNTACLFDGARTSYVPEGSSECGNGVVDEGEECDCGNSCVDNCCHCCTQNCQLMDNAQCANGECCDISVGAFATCRFREADFVCRGSQHDTCDQAETCTGTSAECPADITGADGASCSSAFGEESYCLAGSCLTRDDQCRQHWSQDFRNGADECYEYSLQHANQYANCGTSGSGNAYVRCEETGNPHYTCGLLQCQASTNDDSVLQRLYLRNPVQNSGISTSDCRSMSYADWQYPLEGRIYVADGSKCGENKACLNMDCLDKEVVFAALVEPPPETSICGDGIIQGNEQCDCGSSMQSCGCCDPVTCQYIPENEACVANECRRCTGSTAECENDMPIPTPCEGNTGQCYDGDCVSATKACQRYFSPSAVAATDVMALNSQNNITQSNGGGYMLKPAVQDGDDWIFWDYVRADGDGLCGLLLCNTTASASVPFGDTGIDYTSATFRMWAPHTGTKYVFYLVEMLSLFGRQYRKFYPVFVDEGSPCSVDGHPGYCSTDNVQPDHWGYSTHMRARCVLP